MAPKQSRFAQISAQSYVLQPRVFAHSLHSVWTVQTTLRFTSRAQGAPVRLQVAKEPLARLRLFCCLQLNFESAVVFVVKINGQKTLFVCAKPKDKALNGIETEAPGSLKCHQNNLVLHKYLASLTFQSTDSSPIVYKMFEQCKIYQESPLVPKRSPVGCKAPWRPLQDGGFPIRLIIILTLPSCSPS